MKIWNGYSSEHSMNLVLIGSFKDIETAEATLSKIENLIADLEGKVDFETRSRFSPEISEILKKNEIWNFGPDEIEQFALVHNLKANENKIVITTDEIDISAFIKLMISGGARIEIYSAHDYPDTEHGRGK